MNKTVKLAALGLVVTLGSAVVAFRSRQNQPLQAVHLSHSPESKSISDIKPENYYSVANQFNFPNLSLQNTQYLLGKAGNWKVKKNSQLMTKEVSLEDRVRFQQLMEDAEKQKLADLPMSEIMQAIANQFVGARYKANLLDNSKEESLVVWLDRFDCVLFVETVLAIARQVAVQDYSYQTFLDRIRDQRYRNGELNGYCSRLHYFSDWIANNENRQTVQNISLDLGGVTQTKSLNFMSKHRRNYLPMVSNDSNYQCIVQTEANLNGVDVNYIPKNRIRQVYSQLRPGDIVAVATNIDGLDVTHTGLVYRHANGNLGLIHASPAGMVTTTRDLQSYVQNVKNAIGIVVARPLEPRTRSVD